MKAKGFAIVEEDPDLMVIYHGGLETKVKLDQYQYKYPEESAMTYDKGTLIVDLVDPGSGTVVWRGTAEGMMPENANFDDKKKVIDKGCRGHVQGIPAEIATR